MTRKDDKGDQLLKAVERRPGQTLERHDLAEASTRQANLETACLRATTGHNGGAMVMMMMTFGRSHLQIVATTKLNYIFSHFPRIYFFTLYTLFSRYGLRGQPRPVLSGCASGHALPIRPA